MLGHWRHRTDYLDTEIHLQNELVIVNPSDRQDAAAQDDQTKTLLNGFVTMISDVNIALWVIRISFVVQYHYRLPGSFKWEQAVLHEQFITVRHDGQAPSWPSYVKDEQRIARRIDFAILLPSDTPTYEILPNAKIMPQIKVDVEFGRNTWSESAIAALPLAPPSYLDNNTRGNVNAGLAFCTKSWSGTEVHPHYGER